MLVIVSIVPLLLILIVPDVAQLSAPKEVFKAVIRLKLKNKVELDTKE